MVNGTISKTVMMVQPQAIVDNAEFVGSKGSTPVSVDTLGFDWADVYVAIGALDIAMVEMEVWESDDNSSYALATGAEFGGTGLPTLPAATDDNKLYAFHLNLQKRKRYLQIYLKGGDGAAGTYAVAWAQLSRAEQTPDSASDRGLTAEIFV